MARARFTVRYSDGWITCKPLNPEAKEIIHGKLVALWPGPKYPTVYEPFIYTKTPKSKMRFQKSLV